MLILDHVSKRYGSVTAVDDLSLSVEKGQVVGLLGKNGAGKSTTLNMITGCTAPDSGTISIDGYDIIADHRDAKRCIGYMPEIVPLYDEMTVEAYLRYVCKLKEIRKNCIESHIEEIYELLGLADIRKRIIANLSKGLRQRVGIAQSLCGNPDILIMDEPTIGLDPVQMIEFRNLINSLSNDHTIIISSHILSEIQEICNRSVILHHGKKVYDSKEADSETETRTVSVCARISCAGFVSLIDELHDILSSEVTEEKNRGLSRAVITVDKNNNILEQELFAALSKADAPIYELVSSTDRLEDKFVLLTK